jgi:hypothetical protein
MKIMDVRNSSKEPVLFLPALTNHLLKFFFGEGLDPQFFGFIEFGTGG